MNPLVIIPARMAASRLPGKPMAEIGGAPMIVRVMRQAQAAAVGRVVVAAGDPEIAWAAEAAGGEAVLTDPDLASGSDRVLAALEEIDPDGAHDVVVNLQGDMPFVAPAVLTACVGVLAADLYCDIATAIAPESSPADRADPAVVKAIVTMARGDVRARALYFTRSILYGDGPIWKHVGIYAYRRAALARFAAAAPSPLERRESLEQLRALELGLSIWAAVMDETPISVDTPADLEAARAFAARRRNQPMTQRPKIAYQGEPGAFSHEACRVYFPDHEAVAFISFEAALEAVKSHACALGMIPVENSTAGRVSEVHHLLPDSGLKIIGERFKPIHFQLMAGPGATVEGLKSVASMPIALGQCRKLIRRLKLRAEAAADTAGSARALAEHPDPTRAVLAPALAAELYGLAILLRDVEDEAHNTTRFLVMTGEADPPPPPADVPCVTSFVFRVRNLPAALYKAMGGFATNGVNMTKLESYMENGAFTATFFYAEVDGRPDDAPMARAFEELAFFSDHVEVLGVYPADPFRLKA